MPNIKDIIGTNQDHWNKRVQIHAASEMYDVQGFLNGESSLRHIELDHLKNDINGKDVLHLQCHFGLDSFSLERCGARVTAVDFSHEAIKKAEELKVKLGSKVRFILSDIMELTNVLNDSFDMVFTSYGTLVWLPDIKKWGNTIDHFLRPGGEFFMVDFHPVMYMLDDNFEQLHYDYFRKNEPFHSQSTGTYANPDAPLKTEEFFWNQGLSEIMSPFIHHGYSLLNFNEFDYSPYPCFPNMEKTGDQKFVFNRHQNKIPYLFLVHMKKKSP